jgi:hypothetical protein
MTIMGWMTKSITAPLSRDRTGPAEHTADSHLAQSKCTGQEADSGARQLWPYRTIGFRERCKRRNFSNIDHPKQLKAEMLIVDRLHSIPPRYIEGPERSIAYDARMTRLVVINPLSEGRGSRIGPTKLRAWDNIEDQSQFVLTSDIVGSCGGFVQTDTM